MFSYMYIASLVLPTGEFDIPFSEWSWIILEGNGKTKNQKIETDDLHNTIKILVNELDKKSEDLVVSISITMNITMSGVLS